MHPKFGYPFSIVGINITSWIYNLLIDGHLKTHFYNDSELLAVDKINMENFHKIYSKNEFQKHFFKFGNNLSYITGITFVEFDKYWFINEPRVMHFENLSKNFVSLMTEKLKNDPHLIIGENFLGKSYSKDSLLKPTCCVRAK